MPDPYISEVKYRGPASNDFVEVAAPVGDDVSGVTVVIYHPNGGVRSTNTLGTAQGPHGGKDVYVINNGVHKDGAVALVKDGVVLQFISFDSAVTATAGPAAGMTSTQVGSTGTNQNMSLVSNDGGASYTTQTPPDAGVVPCFVTGTTIMTRRGARPVETLRAGDEVLTMDHGFQTLRWTGAARVALNDRAAHGLRPIEVTGLPGSASRPDTPLLVSPNHRIVLGGATCELLFGHSQVLVPAKTLLGSPFARVAHEYDLVTYHHLLFDRHEIVFSNGLATESFHPGAAIMDALDRQARQEILALFPALDTRPSAYGPTARCELRAHEASVLLAA